MTTKTALEQAARLSYPLPNGYLPDTRVYFAVEGDGVASCCSNCVVALKDHLLGNECVKRYPCNEHIMFKPVVVAKPCAGCKGFDAGAVVGNIVAGKRAYVSIGGKAEIWFGCNTGGCYDTTNYRWCVPIDAPALPAGTTLNGCEKCTCCPAGAKKGDKCKPVADYGLNTGIGEGFSAGGNCRFFVEKACQNCGLKVDDVCNVVKAKNVAPGDCSLFGHKYWTPRTVPAPTSPDKVRDAIERAIGYIKLYPHGQVKREEHGDNIDLCAEILEGALKDYKSGSDGNVAPPEKENCPAVYVCGDVKIWREASFTERARAEKAEAELANVNRQFADARSVYLAEHQQLADEILTHSRASAMYNQVEAECNSLKAELARVKAEFSKYIESHVGIEVWNDIRDKLVAAEQRAQAAEAASKQWELRDATLVPMLKRELAEAEARLAPLTDMLALQQRANDNLAGIGEKVEPFVPRWAKGLHEKCQGCKHARLSKAFLSFLEGDWYQRHGCNKCNAGCNPGAREPRSTRSQRRAANVKGQLKVAEKTAKENLQKFYDQCEQTKRVMATSVSLENVIKTTGYVNRAFECDISADHVLDMDRTPSLNVRVAFYFNAKKLPTTDEMVLFRKDALPKTVESDKP